MLVIGGTGTISAACVDRALSSGIDVTVLNRGLAGRRGEAETGAAGSARGEAGDSYAGSARGEAGDSYAGTERGEAGDSYAGTERGEAGTGAAGSARIEAGTGAAGSARIESEASLGCGQGKGPGGGRRRGRLRTLVCDIHDEAAASKLLDGERFDAVADFVAYTREHAERDIRLFEGVTRQYIFISSATVYQKPAMHCPITESAPLRNPFSQYARDKIECELALGEEFRRNGFPVTIVRPSHTYCERGVPVGIHGENGSWQVLRRIIDGKPVLVHGDGTTWWTFTHSEDFAKGFVGLIANPRAIGEAVHITSDEYLSWNEAYRVIGSALGREPVLAHVASEAIVRRSPSFEGGLLGDKAYPLIFDNSKIKRLVPGFCATVRFDQGVRRAVEHIMACPELQKPDPEFDAFCDEMAER